MTVDHSAGNNVRHNFVAGVLHGAFYRAGMAFSEPMSVLPVFLSHFTGSLAMIGVFSALMQGGGVLPQLFVASRLEGRRRKKPVLVAAIWVRAAAWGILGSLTFFWSAADPTAVLVALVLLLFVFSFASIVVSYIALSSVREPDVESGSPGRPLGVFLRDSLRMVREDRNLGLLLVTQLAIGFGSFAMPFYALYGKNELGMPVEEIGYLVGAQVIGAIASNALWGELSDRIGNRSVIRLTGALGVLVPLLTLAPQHVGGPRLLIVVFALIGCAGSGAGIGFTNYLLEIAPAPQRPAYVAIDGTVAGISFILPVAGGLVVDLWGYPAAFSLTAAVVGVGAVLALALGCVREDAGPRQSGV